MKQIIMIGIVGIVAAVLGFAACEIAQPLVHAENTAVAADTTNTVDTAANTAAIWDTTASDTIYLGSWWMSGRPVMQYFGVVRLYHPQGTAAIVRLFKNNFHNDWIELEMIYITPQGNIVAARENMGTISAKWRCIRPIPGDSIHEGRDELVLPVSAVLTKDPTACTDMFK